MQSKSEKTNIKINKMAINEYSLLVTPNMNGFGYQMKIDSHSID